MAASEHNKYGPGYGASQVRHHEWRTAENSSQHLLPKLKAIVKDNPTLKLLDVGAGSGTISASLAKYMPQGQVVATDISDEILARAKEYAESQGISNIKFQQANVFELPFPDSAFDITHAHQVLCHLDKPADAIREMLRVTKPGGTLSLRESDMHMWCFWPELPGLFKFHENQLNILEANGGQVKGGRQLVSWALKAGVARDDITASFGTWCYSAPEDRRAWAESMKGRLTTGHIRTTSIELGLATESDLDEMVEAWNEWMETDDATLGIMNGEVLIEKK
ncbi:delta-24-sterol methyltransferase [Fusarium albosuccineum]|uniref:Delta-24-sterol methyltransferase n=1 Tax=Fusarium albosuccineum TaxID=1237068 RepID=A0A8H4NVH3_9HYPO|nr:delta-24-sterol methyltransferase [Fusarium albosuccineum]